MMAPATCESKGSRPITDSYDYDAFGNQLNSTGTTPNNYLYRGEQFDSDLGLYYLRARYYNPTTGRFLSRDPEDGKLIDPKTLHKYLYASADPINLKDPTGRDDEGEDAEEESIIPEETSKPIEKVGETLVCKELLNADVLRCAENFAEDQDFEAYEGCLAKAELNYELCKAGVPRRF